MSAKMYAHAPISVKTPGEAVVPGFTRPFGSTYQPDVGGWRPPKAVK